MLLIVLINKYKSVLLVALYALVLYSITSPHISLPLIRTANPRLFLFIGIFIARPNLILREARYLQKYYKEVYSIYAWIAYIIFSMVFISGLFTIEQLYQNLGNLVYYFLVVYVVSKTSKKQLILFLTVTVCGFLLNMYGRLPFILNVGSLPLIYGVTRHQVAAGSAMYALPLMLLLYDNMSKVALKIVFIALIAYSAVIVILSGARVPLLGYTIIMILYRRTIRRYVVLGIISMIFIPIIINSTYAQFSVDRIRTLTDNIRSESYVPEEVRFREQNIEYAKTAVSHNPVFGVGLFGWATEIYSINTNRIGDVRALHNGYMLILAELGIVGLIMYFVMIYLHAKGHKFELSGEIGADLGYVSLLMLGSIFVYSFGEDAFLRREVYQILGICMGTKIRNSIKSICKQPSNLLKCT